MHTETKAMICTAAVLIAMGIFKELAAVCLITALIYEEGAKRFDEWERNSERAWWKKNAPPEAATPEGADINNLTQVHYSTESEKEQWQKSFYYSAIQK